MSNFLKRTKRAWEENEYDKANSQRRNYPLTEQECYPVQAQPMFDAMKLREACDYYMSKKQGICTPEDIFNYLYRLEKGIPFKDQRYQP